MNTKHVIGWIVLLFFGVIGGYLIANMNKSKEMMESVSISGGENMMDIEMNDLKKETEDTLQKVNTKVSASADGTAIWQFPDKRLLNPEIFGTPDTPYNVELFPLEMRDISEDGMAYTRIKNPSMFSNNIKKTTGSISIVVEDLTAKDRPDSKDTATVEANFKWPNGENFRVVLKKLIPVWPDHPFFGWVGTNVLMHGGTGIWTPLVEQEFSYITLWGLWDLYKNDKLIDTKRIVHVMASERTRDENFQIGFWVALPNQLEVHLALPPKKGSPNGPIDSPVPTWVILKNGSEQPFMHVNFYDNIKIKGNKFVK